MINEKEIEKVMEEVEDKLKTCKLDLVGISYFKDLLECHNHLWDLLLFKREYKEMKDEDK